jgi:phosphonate transport system substrate-binding protein
MKKNIYIITAISVLLLIVISIGYLQFFHKSKTLDLNQWVTVKNPSKNEEELKFAIASMVSAEPTWHSYKDLVNIVAAKVGLKSNIILRSCYKDVRNMLEQDKIDIGFVCTGTYIASFNRKSLELLVVPEFENGLEYKCYIITNSNSNILNNSELKGKVFAYTDPESNTGCIVPKWIFKKINIKETDFKKVVFTGSHDKSIIAVSNGYIDAAAVDALIYHSMINHDNSLKEKLRILWESPSFGIPPIVVNKNIDMEKKEKLKQALINFGKTDKEKDILKELQITRFKEPDPESYRSVIKIWKEVGAIPIGL